MNVKQTWKQTFGKHENSHLTGLDSSPKWCSQILIDIEIGVFKKHSFNKCSAHDVFSWITFIRNGQSQNILKQNIVKVFESKDTKNLNRNQQVIYRKENIYTWGRRTSIPEEGEHLYLRMENISFINNFMF